MKKTLLPKQSSIDQWDNGKDQKTPNLKAYFFSFNDKKIILL
jgi:hypothetical protein